MLAVSQVENSTTRWLGLPGPVTDCSNSKCVGEEIGETRTSLHSFDNTEPGSAQTGDQSLMFNLYPWSILGRVA